MPPTPTLTKSSSSGAVSSVAHAVVLTLRLPEPIINVGPDPSVNEWNKSFVGLPIWLWTNEPATASSTITSRGGTFTLNAVRESVDFDLGDGTTLNCPTMTPYDPSVEPGTPSPTCGHNYQTPSPLGGTYTITATAHWTVSWSALGFAGVIPVNVNAVRNLPVGELQSIIVHR